MAVHHILFCCILIFLLLNERCLCEARAMEEYPVYNISSLKIPLKELGAGSFGVVVGFGTPRQDFNMFLDSGSDLSWIQQCKPCSRSNCNNSQIAIFDTTASSTFSDPCFNSSSSVCDYSITYNDGSCSVGSLVRDTMTLSFYFYSDFIFGCSLKIGGDFDGADGLIAIGPGSDSLISQASNFLGIFCYCLPPNKSSTGFILFGAVALATCTFYPENFLPLLGDSNGVLSYYQVNLVGITIGHTRLDMEAFTGTSLLSVRVDTGTTISRLPGSVHEALKSEFKKLMTGYSQAPPLSELLDTCYNLTGYNNVSVPNMILHFQDSRDVQLDPSAVLWRQKESQVCLAFAGNKKKTGLNILGGHNQRSLKVFYDIRGMKMAFGEGSCTDTVN